MGEVSAIARSVRVAANFFKHADKDPDARVNVEPLPQITEGLLYDTVRMLQAAAGQLPFEAQLYWAWYLVKNDDVYESAGPAVTSIIQNNAHLRDMSFPQIRQLLRFQQALNQSEPLPAWVLLSPGKLPPLQDTIEPVPSIQKSEVPDS